jgi:hypothetical protein
MSESSDPCEWLDKVRERKGRLLRTTLDPAPGGRLAALALTFDVGTVQIRAVGSALVAEAHAAGQGEVGTPGDEQDPWWAIVGSPLHRVSAHEGGVLLQFREDSESPRVLLLRAEGAALRVRTVV